MTLTLDATVGGASANSFLTVAEANTYHESRLPIDQSRWFQAALEEKTLALVHATRELCNRVEWTGSRVNGTQALAWPRYGMLTVYGDVIASTTIPDEVKDATAELASWLLTRTENQQLTSETDQVAILSDAARKHGISQLQTEALTLTMNGTRARNEIPLEAVRLMPDQWMLGVDVTFIKRG